MRFATSLLGAVAGAALLAAPAAAYGPETGYYLGLGAGANTVGDLKFESGPFNADVEFDGWDFAGSVAAGYDGGGWRLELEGAYRQNEGDSYLVALPLRVRTPSSNEITQTSVMVNGFWDTAVGDRWTFSLGLGVGAVNVDVEVRDALGALWDDSEWKFAYQGIVGLSYRITDRIDLGLEYRYMSMEEPSFRYLPIVVPPVPAFDHDIVNLDNHGGFAALRYNFGAVEQAPPPAAEAPAPLPVEVKEFVVYFDFDKANLTAEAQSVVAEAAAAVTAGQNVSVTVVGHTDTVGSAAYNQRLSERRANAVKNEMVRLGVAEGQVTTQGVGFSQPAVDTGPGVREPRNRRATINF